MDRLDVEPGFTLTVAATEERPALTHEFDRESIDAVEAALLAGRPLLLRGEPGVGKSQLAWAAAHQLRRPLVRKVITARTEAQDLLWHFDPIRRLAEAQILGAARQLDSDELNAALDEVKFTRPGPLWWAFNWASAKGCPGGDRVPSTPNDWQEGDGVVVLLDEIDKADSDVPNGLLQALGDNDFQPPGSEPVRATEGRPPLIVITTNEERSLPDAFLRRCLVLKMALPTEPAKLGEFLVRRGEAHFPNLKGLGEPSIIGRCVALLLQDRAVAIERSITPPGQAELLDLLRALDGYRDRGEPLEPLVDRIAGLTFRKHPESERQ